MFPATNNSQKPCRQKLDDPMLHLDFVIREISQRQAENFFAIIQALSY